MRKIYVKLQRVLRLGNDDPYVKQITATDLVRSRSPKMLSIHLLSISNYTECCASDGNVQGRGAGRNVANRNG